MKTGAKLFTFGIIIAVAIAATVHADLSSDINRIVRESSQAKVIYGINVIEAGSGKVLYNLRASEPMTPASNMKLVTTAAAIHYLGSDYAYQTHITLKGDTLVIIGSGDPLFGDPLTNARQGRKSDWIMQDIAGELIARDVEKINDIIVDTTIFDDQLVNPSWPAAELNRWYACETSGLNYYGNCIEITCRNNNGKIEVTLDPQTGFLTLQNKIRAIRSGSQAVGAYRTEQINTLVLKGKCKTQQGPFRVAIERPGAYFAYLLAEHLAQNSIKIEGQIIEKGVVDRSGLRIVKTYTTSLDECLARSNKDSFGLAAECLMKTISANVNGNSNGSWDKSREMIGSYLNEIGIGSKKFNIDDGSGLSKANKLSPDAITTLLNAMYKGRNWQQYKMSLAAGGVDGTIKKYFKEPNYKGKVLGKTGYINGVKSFSGYCEANGKGYIFSIIAYRANGKSRAAINSIAKAIVDNAN